jgi:hypothetical protein
LANSSLPRELTELIRMIRRASSRSLFIDIFQGYHELIFVARPRGWRIIKPRMRITEPGARRSVLPLHRARFPKLAGPVLVSLAMIGLLSVSGCSGSSAQTTQPLVESRSWQQASSHYQSGNFAEAFRDLQSQPSDDARYFYNLGTVLLRLGRLGHSLAYLEKANRMQRHDPMIQHNLQIARSSLGSVIGAGRLDPASTWAEEIADRVTLEEIRGALGLVGSILVLMWMRFYLRTRRLRKTLLHPAAIIASAAFVITCGLYAAERLAESHPPAVLLERQTVRSGPGDHYLELAEIESGMKLRILGPIADSTTTAVSTLGSSETMSGANAPAAPKPGEPWRQVRYSQDGIGWVRASSLLLL